MLKKKHKIFVITIQVRNNCLNKGFEIFQVLEYIPRVLIFKLI